MRIAAFPRENDIRLALSGLREFREQAVPKRPTRAPAAKIPAIDLGVPIFVEVQIIKRPNLLSLWTLKPLDEMISQLSML